MLPLKARVDPDSSVLDTLVTHGTVFSLLLPQLEPHAFRPIDISLPGPWKREHISAITIWESNIHVTLYTKEGLIGQSIDPASWRAGVAEWRQRLLFDLEEGDDFSDRWDTLYFGLALARFRSRSPSCIHCRVA